MGHRCLWIASILFLLAAPTVPGKDLPATPPLSVPAGAMIYAETADLNGLLEMWDASAARTAWEGGAMLELFRRSRLSLKLEDRRSALSGLAGVELDLDFLRELGAARAAAALYDPGKREALLAVELPSGAAVIDGIASALPEQRYLKKSYRGGLVEGQDIFLGLYREGTRAYLATSERLIKELIRLGQEGGGYACPVPQAASGTVLRLDLDLEAIRRTPHFQRYWRYPGQSRLQRYAREWLTVSRADGGWVEERRFLEDGSAKESATPAEAGFPAVTVANPYWQSRRQVPPAEVFDLILDGIIRLPAGLRQELTPEKNYTNAALGASVVPESDFNLQIDVPPAELNRKALWSETSPAGAALLAVLEAGGPWAVRWTWELRRDVATGNWTRQEGGLVLTAAEPAKIKADELRDVLTRVLAAAYLCNPSAVDWQGPLAKPGTQHCLQPVELVLEERAPGVILLTTSGAQLEQARKLAEGAILPDQASRLLLTEGARKYLQLLNDLNQPPAATFDEETAPRLMEDVIPSLLEVLDKVAEIRLSQQEIAGGTWQKLNYRLRP